MEPKQPLECIVCGLPVPPGSRKFCSQKHQYAHYYDTHKYIWEELYRQRKLEYRKSGAKRAGVSIWRWLKLPKDFRRF